MRLEPEIMKKYNFNPGPAILPKEVLEEASRAVTDLNSSGLSILEISHRSSDFEAVMSEAKALASELYKLPSDYEVLFIQGGASTQFLMSAMNLLGDGGKGAFINTGNWSDKAIKEARLVGNIDVVASSKEQGYTHIPKNVLVDDSFTYVHITSNNTVRGTQYANFPSFPVKMVADMSSDIFSRQVPIEKFGIIYAGAQKNLGPAGATLVIVDKNFINRPVKNIPTMLNYHTHITKNSMFNTPPVFSIYVSMLNLRWIKRQGGLSAMEKLNTEKAELLYSVLDSSSIFVGTAEKADRSKMNITFLLKDETLSPAFLADCQEAHCIGIKGHRSAGGFRASIYNAMDLDGVRVLCDVIENFEKQHA